jgi:small subunit ribosomal protein S1
MKPLTVGTIIEAVVTRPEQYAAWIDCAGRAGVVTFPEVSWSRIRHPGDVLSVGQSVRVKVLVAPESKPFSASIRAVRPDRDPWYEPALFAVGAEFVGPVVLSLDYGCFVELRPDVWGLLPRGRWSGSLKVGDRALVRVESVDVAARKVEVSIASEMGRDNGLSNK